MAHATKPIVRCAACGKKIEANDPRYEVMRVGARGSKKHWGVLDDRCFARATGRTDDVLAALKTSSKRLLRTAEAPAPNPAESAA